MGFMHDQLEGQRLYLLLNVIDDHNRKALGMGVDISLPTECVIRSLVQIIEWRGKPATIRSDNGSKYVNLKLKKWSHESGISLLYTQQPSQQNTYVKRFNEQFVMTDWHKIFLKQ